MIDLWNVSNQTINEQARNSCSIKTFHDIRFIHRSLREGKLRPLRDLRLTLRNWGADEEVCKRWGGQHSENRLAQLKTQKKNRCGKGEGLGIEKNFLLLVKKIFDFYQNLFNNRGWCFSVIANFQEISSKNWFFYNFFFLLSLFLFLALAIKYDSIT